jgi:xanthine/uracil permease
MALTYTVSTLVLILVRNSSCSSFIRLASFAFGIVTAYLLAALAVAMTAWAMPDDRKKIASTLSLKAFLVDGFVFVQIYRITK